MAIPKEFDQRIADIATERQLIYYKSWCDGNSHRQIGKAEGIHHGSVGTALRALDKRATASGLLEAYSDETGAGTGRIVNKVTTHIKNGEKVQEWVRTDSKAEDVLAMMEEAVKVLAEEVKGKSAITPLEWHCKEDLVSLYPLFDKHYGMLSWKEESGVDYDLSIAKATERAIFNRLVESQPHSKEALIVFGGDYFHADDDNQVTPSHRNKVDVDGRSFKVFGTGVEMAKEYIAIALTKHEHVTVELIPGNHDPVLSMSLLFVIDAFYSNNERVTVKVKPGRFSYYEFGSTLLCFQHGDKMKQERMYQVVTSDMREAWGRVDYCHVFTGHFHRERKIDIGLCTLESLRTTVPNEAYACEAGYRSPRTAYAITFSKTDGECGRTMQNIKGGA